MGMTIDEAKDEYGDNADTMIHILCTCCTANDWYCPSYCKSMEWIQHNYDKAIERIAKLDGDYVEFMKRLKTWSRRWED